MKNFQIIILAAGKGTRMNSDRPKVLVELHGKSLIRRLLDNLGPLVSELDPVIVVGHKKELVMGELGSNFCFGDQTEQLGTANAVLAAKPWIDAESVIVLYGDMPFIREQSIKNLIELFENSNSKFAMFTAIVPNFENEYQTYSNFGRIVRKDGQLKKIVEVKYATEEEKKITEVNPGIYMFDAKWLWDNIEKIKKNSQGEYYLTDLMEIAEAQGFEVCTTEIDPLEVYGINTPEQLKVAESLMLQG